MVCINNAGHEYSVTIPLRFNPCLAFVSSARLGRGRPAAPLRLSTLSCLAFLSSARLGRGRPAALTTADSGTATLVLHAVNSLAAIGTQWERAVLPSCRSRAGSGCRTGQHACMNLAVLCHRSTRTAIGLFGFSNGWLLLQQGAGPESIEVRATNIPPSLHTPSLTQKPPFNRAVVGRRRALATSMGQLPRGAIDARHRACFQEPGELKTNKCLPSLSTSPIQIRHSLT